MLGVKLRSPADGMRLRAPEVGCRRRGMTRPPRSKEWGENISIGKMAAADSYAVGVSLKPNGYIEYTRGEHKGRSVHVVIMERLIGRRINRGEIVHHVDEDRQNNEDTNLGLMTRSDHAKLHRHIEMLRRTEKCLV